jgi:hypothetical protein
VRELDGTASGGWLGATARFQTQHKVGQAGTHAGKEENRGFGCSPRRDLIGEVRSQDSRRAVPDFGAVVAGLMLLNGDRVGVAVR